MVTPICQQPLANPNLSWSYSNITQTWYAESQNKATWQSSKDFCFSQGVDINLLAIYSQDENQIISEMFDFDKSYWLSGISEDLVTWFWTQNFGQAPIDFENWAPNYPDKSNPEAKFMFLSKSLWYNQDGNLLKNFICEYRCPELPETTTVDPNFSPEPEYVVTREVFSTPSDQWFQVVMGNDEIGNITVPRTYELSFDFKFTELGQFTVFHIDYQLPEIFIAIVDQSNKRHPNDTWSGIYSYLDAGYDSWAYSYLQFFSGKVPQLELNQIYTYQAIIKDFSWEIYLDGNLIQSFNFILETCYSDCDKTSRFTCNCQKMRDTPYIPRVRENRKIYTGGKNAPNKYKFEPAYLRNIVINEIDTGNYV